MGLRQLEEKWTRNTFFFFFFSTLFLLCVYFQRRFSRMATNIIQSDLYDCYAWSTVTGHPRISLLVGLLLASPLQTLDSYHIVAVHKILACIVLRMWESACCTFCVCISNLTCRISRSPDVLLAGISTLREIILTIYALRYVIHRLVNKKVFAVGGGMQLLVELRLCHFRCLLWSWYSMAWAQIADVCVSHQGEFGRVCLYITWKTWFVRRR